MIDGVIFDMDGLMLDTEPLWAQQWAPTLATFGLDELPGLADAARGTTGDAACAVLRSFYGDDLPAETVFDEYRRLAALRFEQPVPKKPGLDELLAYLSQQSIPAAVASSSPIHVIRRNLQNAGIEGAFAHVVAGAEVERSKPAPDIFLEAARRLGVDPARALVLEDSFPGVRAGAAGGFVTVMVPDIMQPTGEIRDLCAAVLPSLHAVRAALEACEL